MSPAISPAIAKLTPAEKLELVGELWDQLAADGLAAALTPAQEAELRAEREAIRLDPHKGSCWTDVKSRILGQS